MGYIPHTYDIGERRRKSTGDILQQEDGL